MKNSADFGGCYPPWPSASVDNILIDLQNSLYPTHRPHSIITKSTEWHPCLPNYSSPLFPTIVNHCSLHHNLSPQVGLLGMRRKLRSTFTRSKSLYSSSLRFFYPGTTLAQKSLRSSSQGRPRLKEAKGAMGRRMRSCFPN